MIHFMFLKLFIFIKIIQALDYADFGLPNKNPCAFNHNGKFYIINQESLAISFNRPWNSINSPQIITHNLTTVSACSVTRSGKVILMPLQQQPLQVIDDINLSWNLNSNITYLGSQNAIDLFIKRTTPFTRFISAAFNDFIMIFSGGVSDDSNTFMLDTRNATQYTWHEISVSTNTRSSNQNSILYATSRWILLFQIDLNIIYIYCFDPINLEWYGLISTIELNSNATEFTTIQVIPTFSLTANFDSFIITIIQETKNQVIYNLWEINISTLIPDIINITLLNPIIQQSNKSGGGSVLVTQIDDEMILFYGGKENLGFFNMTSKSFISLPQWVGIAAEEIPIQQEKQTEDHLGIILGTVIGGVVFIIVILILFIWFKKRNNVSLSPKDNTKTKSWPFINQPDKTVEKSPSISQFTLAHIKRLSPINLFPLPSDDMSSSREIISADEGIAVLPQQPKIKSRFIEHFDYHDSIAPASLILGENQSISRV